MENKEEHIKSLESKLSELQVQLDTIEARKKAAHKIKKPITSLFYLIHFRKKKLKTTVIVLTAYHLILMNS